MIFNLHSPFHGRALMVAVNIRDFPEDLHHKVKVQAAVERITFKDLLIRALREYLERRAGPHTTKEGRG
jgi:hypothetical protein